MSMPRSQTHRSRRIGVWIGALVCAGLLGASVSPAWAEGGGAEATTAVVGGFGVGDGIEALVDERDGAVTFALPAGGLNLTWDSRAISGSGRFGIGAGWGFGLGVVETAGGVRFAPASGGRYELDTTHPSGLRGYGARDIAFRLVDDGRLPGRSEAAIPEREFRYRLHELGGTVTSFNELGDPVARTTAIGQRTDLVWSDDDAHRLERIVDPDGVVTELDWGPDAVVIRPAANLPLPDDLDRAPAWRIELGTDGITGIEDPSGGRVELTYASGLVSSILGVSGVRTRVEWRSSDDGVPRVARVVAADGDGAELSRRDWSPIGAGVPSGWPVQQHREGAGFLAVGDTYSTELTDGSTAVRSTYSAAHTLASRTMVVTTPSGERVVQEQALGYPIDDLAGARPDPSALPGDWNRPTSTSVTYFADDGASRTATSAAEFDDLGRPLRQTTPDGMTTETTYDEVLPPGALVPVGLVRSVTTIAADGQLTETEHTLNAERTAVVATETRAGRTGAPLTVSGAVEYTVEADGFVSERRDYAGGDRARVPLTTRWTTTVDLAAGTSATTEIAAVGTSAEASASTISSLRHGGVLEQTDPVGNRATTGYDELGRPVSSTDAAERTTTTTYETAQRQGRNAVTVTGPDGVARTEVRDGVGRVELVADNLAHGVATPGHVRVAETREYEGAGTVVVTDAWGAKTISRQDAFGRPIATESPGGLTQLTRYDDVANTVTRAITATGAIDDAELVAVDSLDGAGRTVATSGSRADGAEVPSTSSTFDGLGRVSASGDDAMHSQTAYDALGNAVTTTLTPKVVDPAGAFGSVVTERRFDASGSSLGKTVTDATGVATGGVRAFDAAGRVGSTTDQAGRVTTTEYTADGLVARVVDGNGQVSESSYDGRTRQLIRITIRSPGKPAVETVVEYDAVTGRVASVAEASDRAGTEVRYRYDDFGNVLAVEYPGDRVIEHRYDEHGRRVATTDVTGATTRFEYRADGLMTSAVQTASADSSSPVLASVTYRHDELGRVSAIERGNGVVTAYTFTSASEIATEATTRAGVEVSSREYTYEPDGDLVTRVDRERDEQTGEIAVATTAYRYDALDRLIESTVHDGASADAPVTRRTGYTITVAGDVASETVTTDPETAEQRTKTREFAYSDLGELTAITTDGVRRAQTYDTAGNLVQGADGTTYTYDAANRPTSRTRDGRTVSTAYWGDGARRSQTASDESADDRAAARSAEPAQTTYYWDGGTLLNDVHAGGGAGTAGGAASYLIGTGRLARTTADEAGTRTAYTGTDRRGNVTELTDELGAVQTRYAYSDYGVQTTESAVGAEPATDSDAASGLARNPFGYAGEQTDDDGSLYLRARVYDPASMRFTSEDPAERFDRYNYADLNPIMMVDPSGRTPQWDEIVDLVTGGVALASLAGSVMLAAFTGGLSLTGLGIMGIAADTVTVLAVTARAVDREMPELEILDEDGQKMLLGVELAFGAFGAVGLGADISQLGTAEKLYAVERDADRLLDASLDVSGALRRPISRIEVELFGSRGRPHKYNVEEELGSGDRLIELIDERLTSRTNIVTKLNTFDGARTEALYSGPFLLSGYGTRRVLGKVMNIVVSGGNSEVLTRSIAAVKDEWAAVKANVAQVRAEVSGVRSDAPPPRRRAATLPSRSSRSGYESDDDSSRLLIPDDAFM
jgi:RHS repeat-associated protein